MSHLQRRKERAHIMRIMWELREVDRRPMAVACSDLVGRFAWCEYWRRWDEILACHVLDGISAWRVRGVGETRIREHTTLIPLECVHDAPIVVRGRHRSPRWALPTTTYKKTH